MSSRFLHLGVNTSYFGLKSLIYFSSKIWNIIPDEIKNYLRSEELKIKYDKEHSVIVTASYVERIQHAERRIL